METLTVAKIEEYGMYVLTGKNNKEYKLGFELYGIDGLSVGDKILISKELLDMSSPKFCVPYAFEETQKRTPQEVRDLKDAEYIVVKHDDKIICMKRIYG